jgi:hypothetical protein
MKTFDKSQTGGSRTENVLDVLLDNLQRLWRGEATLRNQII